MLNCGSRTKPNAGPLIQRLRVALDVIHQLGNLLFGDQIEREVARQVGENKSNARISQQA
jgi:hypothetical protein